MYILFYTGAKTTQTIPTTAVVLPLHIDVQVIDGAAFLSCRDPMERCDAQWVTGVGRLIRQVENSERLIVRPRPIGHGGTLQIHPVEPQDYERYSCACIDDLTRPPAPAVISEMATPTREPLCKRKFVLFR